MLPKAPRCKSPRSVYQAPLAHPHSSDTTRKNSALESLKKLVANRKIGNENPGCSSSLAQMQVPPFETACKGEIDNAIKYDFRSYLVGRENVPINDARTLVRDAFWGRYTPKQVAEHWDDIGGKSLEKHWDAYRRERNPNSTSGFASIYNAASPGMRNGFREFAGKLDPAGQRRSDFFGDRISARGPRIRRADPEAGRSERANQARRDQSQRRREVRTRQTDKSARVR